MRYLGFAKLVCVGLIFVCGWDAVVSAKSPWRWISFRRDKPSEGFELTDDAGPWLIFAASFAGEGAKTEAEALAKEIRDQYRLRTYVHSEQFDFTEEVPGIGVNPDRSPKLMRYDKSGVFDEFAVLVGDFESIDDPKLQKNLKRLKYAQPSTLIEAGNRTTRRFAGLRALNRRINGDEEKRRKGPLGHAFATPNPKVPRELIAPRGIDTFVLKMNKDIKHSLLNCKGKFTVRVATFRGNVVIDQERVAEIEAGGRMQSRLEKAAVDAHQLTLALRKKGVEAYEFHDRHESFVTVGSFDWVGRKQTEGDRQEMNPAIVSTIERFAPDRRPVPGSNGQRVDGLQPKMIDGIPFDVQPWPVEVPRRSIAKDYARR